MKKKILITGIACPLLLATPAIVAISMKSSSNTEKISKLSQESILREGQNYENWEINSLNSAWNYFNSNNVPNKPGQSEMNYLKTTLLNNYIEKMWVNTNVGNLESMLISIYKAPISNQNKLWLIYAIKVKIATDNFISKPTLATRSSSGIITEPIKTFESRVLSTSGMTYDAAFGEENLRPIKYLVDIGGKPITLNSHQITIQGETNIWNDWHMINPDVTIINWSNEEIYDRIVRYVREMQSSSGFEQKIKVLLVGIGSLAEEGKSERLREALDVFRSFINSPALQPFQTFLKRVGYWVTLNNFITDVGNFMLHEPIYDAIEKSAAKNLVPFGMALAGTAALGGPIGAVIGLVSELVLNVIPTPNGFTPLDNMFDHGLNDWDFQLRHNTSNVLGIALAFSEDLSHGISWKVKDSILDTPDLWVRPGQVADQPWILLSKDYIPAPQVIVNPVTGGEQLVYSVPATKTFNWGIPIEMQGFEGLTNLRRRYDSIEKTTDNLEYQDTLQVDFYTEYSEITATPPHKGVMQADSNRNYEITFNYIDSNGVSTPFTPAQTVHENDHDNDGSVKFGNWKGDLPSDGIPINDNSVGSFELSFEDGNKLQLPDMTKMLKIALTKAKEYANFVLSYGMHPRMSSSTHSIEISSGSSASTGIDTRNFVAFDQTKNYVAKYYVKSLWTTETRFNTYDDRGWDDTHSDNFRFKNTSIGINVEFIRV